MQLRVLFIEDTEDDIELSVRELKRGGYEVEYERVQTAEALQIALNRQEWDVILCDYSLPQFSPTAALNILKSNGRDLPFIIISGTIGEDTAVSALKAGAHDFLVKGKLARLLPAIQRELKDAETRHERQQAQAAVHASEERFRALIENGSDDISLLDAEGNLLWESPAVIRNLGYPANLFVGRNIQELIHPEDKASVAALQTKLMEAPDSRQDGIFRLRHSDGTWRSVEAVVSNMLDNPSVRAIVVNYHDITQRRQAELQIEAGISDLRLINAVNQAVIRGENLSAIMKLLAKEIKQIFASIGSTIYMLSPDGQSLIMQQYFLSPELTRRIESIIGSTIPLVHIPIKEGSYFHKILNSAQGTITSDPQEIQRWMTEFLETSFLPSAARGMVRKGIPQIYKLLNIKSTIAVPLISNGKAIGVLDVSSPNLFTEADLRRIENISGQLTAAIQRQQADEKIQQSEEFLQSVQNALSANIAIIDETGIIVRVNSAWRKFGEQNGVPYPNSSVGLNYLDVCDSATGMNSQEAPIVANAIREILAGKIDQAQIEYACHSPKEQRWFILSITGFKDGDQKFVVLAHENITERKRMEEELHEAETKYRTLVEQLPAVTYIDVVDDTIKSGKFKTRYISPQVESLLGYAPNEFYTDPGIWMQLIHPDDRERVLAHNAEYLSGRSFYSDEYRMLTKKGPEIWVRDEAIVVSGGNNEQLLSQGVVFNITQRKQAEEKLFESNERFRQLSDNIEEIFWITDAINGEEIYISLAVEKIWGRPLEYLMHTPNAFIDAILPEDRAAVLRAIAEQKNGQRTEREYRILRPDGSVRWIWDRAFPIFDHSGKLVRLAGIAADVTQRKRGEEDAQRLLERQSVVYRAGQEINASLDTEQIFEAVYRAVEKLMPCEDFLISSYDETSNILGGEFILENSKMLAPEPYTADRGLGAHIVHSGQPVLLNSPEQIKTSGINFVPYGAGPVTSSVLAVPIQLKGKIIGILSAQSYRSAAYTNEDQKLLETLASHAASAIDNARLFGQAQDEIGERKQAEKKTLRHLIELEALYENGLAVGRLLDQNEIGQRIITTFARHLAWHHVAIRLIEPGGSEMKLIAFNQEGLSGDELAEAEVHVNSKISKVGQGLSGWAAQTGQPFRTGNVHAEERYVITYSKIQSGLYMPLKLGDLCIGVISVESEVPDGFSEQDERLLATLANQAAVAFENARLYQSAQQELEDRKRAETALRTSETHYRELADSITDIFFELDQNLHYSHWNKASEMLTKVPETEAIGKSLREIFGESEEQTRVEQIYASVLKNQQPRTLQTLFKVNNEQRDYEVNAYPSTRGVAVVAKDVTERKRSEAIMQKRFELMEYAVEHSLEEIMQKTIDEIIKLTGSAFGFFHILEADQASPRLQIWPATTLSLFDVPVSEGRHRSVEQAGVWADAVRQRRAIIHNNYESLPNKKTLPSGHAPIIREILIPIIRHEKILAVMGIADKPQDYTQQDLEIAERFADYAWDITEHKQMELALDEERDQLSSRVEQRTADLSHANSNLARALRVKDEFLANMSHELRTPLNAILGLSESLAEQTAGPLNEKQLRYITTVSESGHHLLSLINDILDLAKIDAGQITLDVNKVEIHSVCDASLRMIKQLASKKNQDIAVEIDSSVSLMWADERRLKQMLVNLLGNAVKFTPEGGKLGLEVHGDQDANKVTFTIWDSGIGIKETDLARLFQPFVQLDSGLSRESSGTGLGLALVAQMARLHGGSTNVTSEPGVGSRFTIMLPWEPALAVDNDERRKITGKFRPVKSNPGDRQTILLIEDTLEVIMMLSDYLELNGFKIVTAQDGVEGITQAQLTHPDLILMDVMMPGMDGFQATKHLRGLPEFEHTPIIALTALAMPSDRERCLAAGMDEYITKPVHLRKLVTIIENFLSAEKEVNPQ